MSPANEHKVDTDAVVEAGAMPHLDVAAMEAANLGPAKKRSKFAVLLASLKTKLKFKLPRMGKFSGQVETGASVLGIQEEAGIIQRLTENTRVLTRGPLSRDRPTRRATTLFWLSLIALLVVGKIAGQAMLELYRHRGPSAEEVAARNFAEREKLKTEINAVSERTYEIGGFSIQLVEPKGRKVPSGMMNIGELDVFIECDSPDTKRSLELRSQKARDQVTLALTPLERDDLVTGDGKKHLKRAIIDQLNRWLTQGHVVNVYFGKVLVL